MAWFQDKHNSRYGGVKHRTFTHSPYYRKKPLISFSVTGWLILANVVAYAIFIILLYKYGQDFLKYVALQPDAILKGKYIWTFLTSMFIHAPGGIFSTHLIVNMISLLFIGSFVEKLIGKKRYIWLYFIGGLFAGLMFVALAGFFGGGGWGARFFGDPMTYAVGASGAIFCLGGLLAVLTPKLRVLVFFIIPMPMWLAMVGLTFFIWALSIGLPLGIGNTAHFGGLLLGVIYGVYLRKRYPRKTRMISRYFSS